MNYANLPKEVLEFKLMEYCDEYMNILTDTVKDELDKNGEDIENYVVDFAKDNSIDSLVIWTKTKVFTLLRDGWGDQLIYLPRNPPK